MNTNKNLALLASAITIAMLPVLGGAPAAQAPGAPAPARASEEFSNVTYTAEQADRGEALFKRYCLNCHYTNAGNRKTDKEPNRGFIMGRNNMRGVKDLGPQFLLKSYPYPSVYHVFARIRDAMPSMNIESVTLAQKVDIIAYLLRESGFRAGPRELPLDAAAMKKMRLVDVPPPPLEPGFERLFNGKDFTNFKFLFGANCSLPPGCGSVKPEAFSIKDGVIVSEGRRHGYMYAEKAYLNFDLRYDFRIVAPSDYDANDEPLITGGGLMLFIMEHQIWPASIEIEGDNKRALHPYGTGVRIDATYDEDAGLRANKGPGPWNAARIVSKNGQIDVFLNGTLVGHVSKHPFTQPGYIAWTYQGGTWMYRDIRIKEE
jgi:hypothetical protein